MAKLFPVQADQTNFVLVVESTNRVCVNDAYSPLKNFTLALKSVLAPDRRVAAFQSYWGMRSDNVSTVFTEPFLIRLPNGSIPVCPLVSIMVITVQFRVTSDAAVAYANELRSHTISRLGNVRLVCFVISRTPR